MTRSFDPAGSKERTRRLFVAVNIPESFASAFLECVEKCQGVQALRATAPKNMHFTVLFLGNVLEDRIPELRERCRAIASDFSPFALTFTKVALAPPKRPARMIWALFDGSGEWKKITDQVYTDLGPYAQKNERKEAIPHVTIARFRDPVDPGRVILCEPSITDPMFTVSSFELMESELQKEGPIYTIIESFKLKKF